MSGENLAVLAEQVENEAQEIFRRLEETALSNQEKVLEAFRVGRVTSQHLHGTTGYGYHDLGRDTLEEVWARIFKAESALVRSQIVSGTHAISLCLMALLAPGEELLSATGTPYDTLLKVIGEKGSEPGSLKEQGVTYREAPLSLSGKPDFKAIGEAIGPATGVIYIQRSRGYSDRPALSVDEVGELAAFIRECKKDVTIFVDNCYGEFVENREPIETGADIVAGSLIKNLGGGLAPWGGYVAGKEELVKRVANRLTAPGLGRDVGPSGNFNALAYQGLFMAPHIVMEALKGAVFAAGLLERLGFGVSPGFREPRHDLIQSIYLGRPGLILAFCRGIQAASPVDSHVRPEPAPMPGYEHDVIMAGGTFIQGSSIELSADAPLREPYTLYLQGGLSYQHVRLAVEYAALECLKVL